MSEGRSAWARVGLDVGYDRGEPGGGWLPVLALARELVLIANHVRTALPGSDDGSTVDGLRSMCASSRVLPGANVLCAADILSNGRRSHSGDDLYAGRDLEPLHRLCGDCVSTVGCDGASGATDTVHDFVHGLFRQPLQHVCERWLVRGR